MANKIALRIIKYTNKETITNLRAHYELYPGMVASLFFDGRYWLGNDIKKLKQSYGSLINNNIRSYKTAYLMGGTTIY